MEPIATLSHRLCLEAVAREGHASARRPSMSSKAAGGAYEGSIPLRLTADTRSERVGAGRGIRQAEDRMGRSSRRVVGVMLVACVALGLTASVASAKPTTKFPVTVTDDLPFPPVHFTVTAPPSEADSYKIQLINNSIGPHVWIAVGGLPAGFTTADLIAALDSDTPPATAFEVGAVFAAPGQKHQKKFDFTAAGRYGYFCPIPTPTGTPHYRLGFAGVFDIAP